MEHILCAKLMSFFNEYLHLILTKCWGKYYNYPHLTDEEPEGERFDDKAKPQTQIWLQIPSL